MKEEDVILHKGIIFRKKIIQNFEKEDILKCEVCPFRDVNPYNKSYEKPYDSDEPMCKFIEITVGGTEQSISAICWGVNVTSFLEDINNRFSWIPTLKYVPPFKTL